MRKGVNQTQRSIADQKIAKFADFFNTLTSESNEEDYVSITFSQSQQVKPATPQTGLFLFYWSL